ncbi:protein unc-13-like protein B-like [Platysternon megacephalum]|uniref:T-cell surface glycoprotein CD8 alpha chain n=1 Tax=Platysternon megacephalum TaxID=55544 RepID=A0A4D9EIJ9_9SAUR|nr:protein unc-13-like protein B-like [Platysternon megacephalum]
MEMACAMRSDQLSQSGIYWYRRSKEIQGFQYVLFSNVFQKHTITNNIDKDRFNVSKASFRNLYTLKIRKLQPLDAGTYYCAVSHSSELLFGNGTELSVVDSLPSTEKPTEKTPPPTKRLRCKTSSITPAKMKGSSCSGFIWAPLVACAVILLLTLVVAIRRFQQELQLVAGVIEDIEIGAIAEGLPCRSSAIAPMGNGKSSAHFEVRKESSNYRLTVTSLQEQEQGNYYCIINCNRMLHFSSSLPLHLPAPMGNGKSSAHFEVRKESSNYRLTVTSLQEQEQGNYYCIINCNRMLHFSSSLPLHLPGCCRAQDQGSKMSVRLPSGGSPPTLGARVELECVISGSGLSDSGVSWMRQHRDSAPQFILFISSLNRVASTENGKPPVRFDAKKESKNYRLTVKSFQEQDQGNYYCIVNHNQRLHFSSGIPLHLPAPPTTAPTTKATTPQPSTTTGTKEPRDCKHFPNTGTGFGSSPQLSGSQSPQRRGWL